jgi:uncharacterized protein (DUF924 family)
VKLAKAEECLHYWENTGHGAGCGTGLDEAEGAVAALPANEQETCGMNDHSSIGPSELLSFWFSEEVKPKWFEASDAFDAELRERFGLAARRAGEGALDGWAAAPEGLIALIILLDQIPRNIHRGTPAAFATDARALRLARAAVANGIDRQLTDAQRGFLYLPFMHSEDLAAQEEGMALYGALGNEPALDYMRRHRDIIARFGRFPHRNDILGRTSTPEEIAFLEQPGSRF